ncbi:unnamed protein product, partial [Adineta steineri]
IQIKMLTTNTTLNLPLTTKTKPLTKLEGIRVVLDYEMRCE